MSFQRSAEAESLSQEIAALSRCLEDLPEDLRAGGAFEAYERRLEQLQLQLALEDFRQVVASFLGFTPAPAASSRTLPNLQTWLAQFEKVLERNAQIVHSLRGEVEELTKQYPQGSVSDKEQAKLVGDLMASLSRLALPSTGTADSPSG